jgi:hypothetical protein
MATPPCMVELRCPNCQYRHWEIDHDYRGSELVGQRELSYEERIYKCPECKEARAGYRVLQKSPPEFFLQPHAMYPMTTGDFAHWLSVFRAQFPSHGRLNSVGVFWYPGEAGNQQERKLHDARTVGTFQGYRLSLSNDNPDDKRIRVCVQGRGEAHFWCGSGVVLDKCYFGFEEADLEKIRDLLVARDSDIRLAWRRFSNEAHEARAKWLPKLLGPPGV